MLEYLLSGLDEGVFVYDYKEQKNLRVNGAITQISGYKASDFKKDPKLWFKLIEPDDKDEVILRTETIKPNEWIELTYRIKTANEHTKWVKSKLLLFGEAETGDTTLINIIKDVTDQKLVNYNLRESLGDYSVLFDQSPSPMWLYEVPSLRILKVNEAAIEHYGYSEREFLERTIRDLRPRIDLAKFNEYLYRRGYSKNSYGVNHGGIWRHQNKNGETLYAEITGHEIKYENNSCRIIIARDVTERIKSEAEIIRREKLLTKQASTEQEIKLTIEKLNTFIESITDVLFVIDKRWKFIRVNCAFEKITHEERSAIIGRSIWDVFADLKGTLVETSLRQAVTENISIQIEEYIEVFGIWTGISAYPSAEGLTVFIRDITFEKAIQEEIAWTKDNLEALINNTDDLIWSIDNHERYVYMNQAYRNRVKEVSGKYPERGDHIYAVMHLTEKGEEDRRAYYERAFSGERYTLRRETVDPISGKIYHSEINFNPIFNSSGQITGIGCFARDITKRLIAEKAIMIQNNQLKHMASLSSHELRGPVASMMGLINILDLHDLSNPQNLEVLRHLQTVSQEIDEVIHQIVNKTFVENLIGTDIKLN